MSSETPGISCVVKLAETIGAGYVEPRNTDADRHGILMVLHNLSSALPYKGPRCNHSQLCCQEYGPGYNDTCYIDAESSRRRIADEDGTVVIRTCGYVGLPCCRSIETEFVCDVDGLYKQHVFTGAWSCSVSAGGSAAAATTVRLNGPKLARWILLIALHRFARGHAGCHEGAELHYLRRRELEGVEMWQQNLERKSEISFKEWIYFGARRLCRPVLRIFLTQGYYKVSEKPLYRNYTHVLGKHDFVYK